MSYGYGFGVQRQKPGGSQASYKEGWIVESLNSGDYMDAAGIVKARRRRGILVKTPLFPTGEYRKNAMPVRHGIGLQELAYSGVLITE